MSRSLTISIVILLISLPVLISCSENNKNQNANTITESLVPITYGRDDDFGVIINLPEMMSIRNLETEVINAIYIANNGFEVAGQIIIETLSIIHDDGTLLVNVPINLNVNIPPKRVVSNHISLPIQVVDEEKFIMTMEAYHNSWRVFQDQSVETRDNSANEARKEVERNFTFEITWRTDHPELAPSRRRVRW